MLETNNLRSGDERQLIESLDRLLRHLRSQSAPTAELAELIVTHDGLGAEAQAALSRTAGRRIHFVLLAPGDGYYAAKNAGFDASTSEIVAFGDSDCWPHPAWLERLLSPFEDPSVQAVAGRTVYRDDLLGAAASSIDFNYYVSPLGEGCTRNFYANNVAFRRETFALNRYRVGETFYRGQCQTLGLRLQAAGVPIHFEPAALTTHRFPDSAAELLRLRLLRGSDLGKLAPSLVGQLAPVATGGPRWLSGAIVWAGRLATSAAALGRQDLSPLKPWEWPMALAAVVGLCGLDGVGLALELAGAGRLLTGSTPGQTVLSYHGNGDRLAPAETA